MYTFYIHSDFHIPIFHMRIILSNGLSWYLCPIISYMYIDFLACSYITVSLLGGVFFCAKGPRSRNYAKTFQILCHLYDKTVIEHRHSVPTSCRKHKILFRLFWFITSAVRLTVFQMITPLWRRLPRCWTVCYRNMTSLCVLALEVIHGFEYLSDCRATKYLHLILYDLH